VDALRDRNFAHAAWTVAQGAMLAFGGWSATGCRDAW
jgi:hypothetical protein